MKHTLIALALGLATGSSFGAIIVGTDSSGLTSFTTSDGLVTLTPVGNNPNNTAALNLGTGFIGVDSGPASGGVTADGNRSAINDKDGDPGTTADQEALNIALSPTVGISSIAFAFSRADGPAASDGIQISGFSQDPGVTVSAGGGAFVDVRWDSGTSSVFAEISGVQFDGTDRILLFSNLFASAGSTLKITANDSDQGGSQAAIRNINYELVPEPGVALLGLLGTVGLLRRRRN